MIPLILLMRLEDNGATYAIKFYLGNNLVGGFDTGSGRQQEAIDIATEKVARWLQDELDLDLFVPESE